jgi:hypothetical protein
LKYLQKIGFEAPRKNLEHALEQKSILARGPHRLPPHAAFGNLGQRAMLMGVIGCTKEIRRADLRRTYAELCH